MLDGFLGRVSKCFALAGAVATIGDICQPIAPVTLWVAAIAIVVLIACYIARKSVPAHKEVLTDGMYVSVFALLLSGGTYVLQGSNQESQEMGFLASQTEFFSRIQGDLGVVNKKLDVIVEKIDGVKKEVSDDPQKELANKGMQFKYDQFLEVLQNQNLEALDLFIDGGMKLKDEDTEKYFYSLHSEKVAERLIKGNAFQYTGHCPDLKYELWKYKDLGFYDTPSKAAVLKGLCGVPAFEKRLDAAIDSENKSIELVRQFNANRESIQQECLQKYPALPAAHYMDKYFKYYRAIESPPQDEPVEEAIAFTMYKNSSSGTHYYAKTESVSDLAKKLCVSMNQEKELPTQKYNHLIGIKEKLF
ncbi:MAG: hypothetical protein KJ989_21220 [Gammaproteobacteria bacterium]|nr:hypothetical protein [Gammaproteobacteria bacterium]